MRIRRLRSRIILFFVALLALVQVAALSLVDYANLRNAHAKASEDLAVGERVFERLMQQRSREQGQAARVLTADFAFREAIATGDVATINSALANHGRRIAASGMLFIASDGRVLGDTLTNADVPRASAYSSLLRSSPATAPIALIEGRALQLIVAPVLAPLAVGWVVVAVPVDAEFAQDLRQLTALEVSFLIQDERGAWRSLASTLASTERSALVEHMANLPVSETTIIVPTRNDGLQARIIRLNWAGDGRMVAVLDRALASATASFSKLRATLIALAAASLLISLAGSAAIASNITQPLSRLAEAATRIERGDYASAVQVTRADEIGRLASTLNHMREGISEREARILRLAYQDAVTTLDNRSKFAEQLAAAIEKAASNTGSLAILVMDLDRFQVHQRHFGPWRRRSRATRGW